MSELDASVVKPDGRVTHEVCVDFNHSGCQRDGFISRLGKFIDTVPCASYHFINYPKEGLVIWIGGCTMDEIATFTASLPRKNGKMWQRHPRVTGVDFVDIDGLVAILTGKK